MTVSSMVSHVPQLCWPQPPVLQPPVLQPPPHDEQVLAPQEEPQLDTPQPPQSLTAPHPPQLDAQPPQDGAGAAQQALYRALHRDLRPACSSPQLMATARTQVNENNTPLLITNSSISENGLSQLIPRQLPSWVIYVDKVRLSEFVASEDYKFEQKSNTERRKT